MDTNKETLNINESTCRACLNLGARNKIFSIYKPASLQYSHIFYSCLSIQVEPEDGLPKLICRKCLNKLIGFYKFKDIVTRNDLRLRKTLSYTQEGKKEENAGKQHEFTKCGLYNNKSTTAEVISENKDITQGTVRNEIQVEYNTHTESSKSQVSFADDSSDSFESNASHEATDTEYRAKANKTTHQCDVCGKILSCKSNLNQHLRRHTGERPHGCDVCGKRFFKAEHVAVHKRTHTGERPHHCSICPKKFIQYAALRAHLRTHSGERPHMCSICGKSFSQSSTLAYHTRIHSGETPFTCKLCGKGFKNAGNLNIHRRFHENERPFSCKICERRFVTSSHLNVHIKQHNGVKSHQCIICGKAFVRSEHLKGHLVIHTGQKPHACKLCPKKYTQNSHLTRHMKTHKT